MQPNYGSGYFHHCLILLLLLLSKQYSSQSEIEEGDAVSMVTDEESDWEPEEEAVRDPASYRINTWDKTVLGKLNIFISWS